MRILHCEMIVPILASPQTPLRRYARSAAVCCLSVCFAVWFEGTTATVSAETNFIVDGVTITFTNGQAYSGATIITNNGTLVLGVDNAVPSDSALVLGGGTFLVGVENYNTNSSLSMGTLTVTANSTIDLGGFGNSGDRNLVFGNSHGIAWTGILTITNWQGVANQQSDVTKLMFGTGGLDSLQLAQIQFVGQKPGAELLDGELIPVAPEAPVFWGAAAVAGFIFWRERRRVLGLVRSLRPPTA